MGITSHALDRVRGLPSPIAKLLAMAESYRFAFFEASGYCEKNLHYRDTLVRSYKSTKSPLRRRFKTP
ncbi:hypothetical protein Pan181_34330 [Aeoliella mucimassa]|uniref:Uncharacterized protein n=1 Tax=Aeoliella mucimassa TaxID=2527972 RepID=A0A518AR72_9BACT|nr:hypothetical protein Pan181_34330 [Aeoliella mucimassa]